MYGFRTLAVVICLSLVCQPLAPVLAQPATADAEVLVPFGTKIYCELQQEVASKKKRFAVGDHVEVTVWRDVVVEGVTVIPAGTPVDTRISLLKSAKIAGQRGKLELEAKSVTLPSGRTIPLDGGYGKAGKGKTALSVSLAALVAWPLIFLKGKKAQLEPGTLFDAYTDQEFTVVSDLPLQPAEPDLPVAVSSLSVGVLYDELGGKKIQQLPLRIRSCPSDPTAPLVVDRVNAEPIEKPLPILVGAFEQVDECLVARGTVELKPLVRTFGKGINRFDVAYDGGQGRVASEVILDIQF